MHKPTVIGNTAFRQHAKLGEVLDEKAVNACLGIYRVNAMSEAMIKIRARGQGHVQSDRNLRINDLMQGIVANSNSSKSVVEMGKTLVEQFTAVHVCVCSENILVASVERSSFANTKVQKQVKRTIVMMTYDFLKGLSSPSEDFARQPNEQLMDQMERLMLGLTPEHDERKTRRVKAWYGTKRSCDVASSFVHHRANNSSCFWGVE